jgi:hypothetical protein
MRFKTEFVILMVCLLTLAGVYGYNALNPSKAGRQLPVEMARETRPQTAEDGVGRSTFPNDRPDGSTSPGYTQLNYDALRMFFIITLMGCAAGGYWMSTREA